MSQAILNAGFLDMLLPIHIYDVGLLCSSGTDKRVCKSALLTACNDALDALGRHKQGWEFIRRHPIRTMWPQVVDLSYIQFCTNPIQSMGKRRYLWRRLDKHLVVCRLRALEASFQARAFYEMSDYFDACIDLVEFSKYVFYSVKSTIFHLTYRTGLQYTVQKLNRKLHWAC
jgi:hypothetical protein